MSIYGDRPDARELAEGQAELSAWYKAEAAAAYTAASTPCTRCRRRQYHHELTHTDGGKLCALCLAGGDRNLLR
jgi:hypothetical protein